MASQYPYEVDLLEYSAGDRDELRVSLRIDAHAGVPADTRLTPEILCLVSPSQSRTLME